MKTILQDIAISPLALTLSRLRVVLCISLLLAGMSESLAQGSTLVVPSGLENTFGNTAADPIFRASSQQIYGTHLFSGVPSGPIQITALAFRVDELGSSPSLDVIIPNITLRMGVFRGDIGSVPRNEFVADYGTTTVFSAQDFHLFGNPGTTFDLKFAFSNPFMYDRNDGQLALTMDEQGTRGLNLRNFDAQSSSDAVYLYAAGFLGVESREIALATTFSYVSVPEPKLSVVLLMGLTLLVAFAKQKEEQ